MDTYAMSSKDSVIEYRVIRSRRKTIEIQIRPDGQVVVRAPIQASEEQIRAFVRKKSLWIRQQPLHGNRRMWICSARRRSGNWQSGLLR